MDGHRKKYILQQSSVSQRSSFPGKGLIKLHHSPWAVMVPLPARDMKDQTRSCIWCCLAYGKRYGQDLSIIPSAWWKGRCLCHFGKMLHAAAIEVGTEGLPEQWLHLHIVKRETGRKSRESFLPEPTLGWDSLCPFPDISDFRSSPCEKKAQILPELLDSFQPIIATPCIQTGTSKSLVLKSCRRTGL